MTDCCCALHVCSLLLRKKNFARLESGACAYAPNKGVRSPNAVFTRVERFENTRSELLPAVLTFALSEQSSWQLANGPQRNQAAFLGGGWLQIHLNANVCIDFCRRAYCFPTHISLCILVPRVALSGGDVLLLGTVSNAWALF